MERVAHASVGKKHRVARGVYPLATPFEPRPQLPARHSSRRGALDGGPFNGHGQRGVHHRAPRRLLRRHPGGTRIDTGGFNGSDVVRIKFDDSGLRRALADYAAGSARGVEAVMRGQGGLFVRDLISVTPPSQGKTSPKAGYAAVKRDIARAVREQGKRRVKGVTPGNVEAIHVAARSPRTGRVPKNVIQQPAVGVKAYEKLVLARVGKLASGWAKAALRLGQKLPPWIARHGTKRGQIGLTFTQKEARIVVTNATPYAGNVRGIQRRVRFALMLRERALTRQLEYAQGSAGRSAGL